MFLMQLNVSSSQPLRLAILSTYCAAALVSIAANLLLYHIMIFLGGDELSKSLILLLISPSIILAFALVKLDRRAGAEHDFFSDLATGYRRTNAGV